MYYKTVSRAAIWVIIFQASTVEEDKDEPSAGYATFSSPRNSPQSSVEDAKTPASTAVPPAFVSQTSTAPDDHSSYGIPHAQDASIAVASVSTFHRKYRAHEYKPLCGYCFTDLDSRRC